MLFAVNLEPILIFNHLLQRLYPNSLKGKGATEVWVRGKPLKWYFLKDVFFVKFTRLLSKFRVIHFISLGLIVVCKLMQKKWKRFSQSKFPIFQCHSAIHWVGRMFKEKILLSNVSTACVLSFTFHIVAEKKYLASVWRSLLTDSFKKREKNRISQM